MWNEVIISSIGTISFLVGSFHLGKFCERKRLELSMDNLKKAEIKNKEIDNLIKEHINLLSQLN